MTRLEEFKSINKVIPYKTKIELVYKEIENGNISKAYDMINAVIESVGIIFIKKQYDIDVEFSNIGFLGNTIMKKGDEFLTVNAYLNMITEEDDEITEKNVNSLIFDFDRILFWILLKDEKFFN